MHIENKLATYSQKAKEKGMDIKKRENRRPMQTDKEFHIGVFEEQKQTNKNNNQRFNERKYS